MRQLTPVIFGLHKSARLVGLERPSKRTASYQLRVNIQGGSRYEQSSQANQNPILWLYGVLLSVCHFLQSLSCSLVADKRQYSRKAKPWHCISCMYPASTDCIFELFGMIDEKECGEYITFGPILVLERHRTA
mgnify:CR=1 FL=1